MKRLERADFLVAFAAALVVLWPILGDFAGQSLGSRYVDGFGTHWFFWFFDEVVAGRAEFVHTDLLFYPTGKDIFAHTGGNVLDAAVSWPLRRVVGSTSAYNLWIGLVIVTNALAGSVLGWAATGKPGWPAGLALALNPYVLQEIEEGRPTQAWLMLPALALAGTWAARTPAAVIGTGVAMAATGWAYWYYGVVVGTFAVAVGLARLIISRERIKDLARLGAAAGVTGLLVAPALALMAAQIAGGKVPGLLSFAGTGVLAPLELKTVEGDPAGLQIFAPLLGLGGALIDEGGLRFIPGDPTGSYVFLGVGAVVSVVAWREKRRAVLVVAAIGSLLALGVATGPAILVGDTFVVNQPWLWVVSHLSFLHRWWWPGRAIVAAFVAFAMLAPLLGKYRFLSLLFPVALGLELFRTPNLPLETWSATAPAPLVCLSRQTEGAVIDLPFYSDQHNLWFQTIHHRPILGGMLMKKPSFGSAGAWQLRKENAFLDLLLDLGDAQLTRETVYDDDERADIVARGFRFVVVDKSRMEGTAVGRHPGTVGGSVWQRVRRLLRDVLGEPFQEDESVAVYVLDGSVVHCVD